MLLLSFLSCASASGPPWLMPRGWPLHSPPTKLKWSPRRSKRFVHLLVLPQQFFPRGRYRHLVPITCLDVLLLSPCQSIFVKPGCVCEQNQSLACRRRKWLEGKSGGQWARINLTNMLYMTPFSCNPHPALRIWKRSMIPFLFPPPPSLGIENTQ